MDFKNLFFRREDYELTTQNIGEGSYGSVFIAINKEDNQEYAAKIINIKDGFDAKQQMLFLRESLTLYQLDYPSIIKFKGINFQSFENPSILQPTIITQYLPNKSLRKYIYDESNFNAPIEWTPTKKYINLLGISNALRYLHKKEIIHRDLKPENILLDEYYYPIICDFGLSRCFPDIHEKSLEKTIEVGTPLYMAPELLRREPNYGKSVDVYAFGILAYEIVTGQMPFQGVSPYEYIHLILSGKRPSFPRDINKTIRTLITRCWSQNPEDRPSFDEIFYLVK